jgi:hypothetical protein
MTRSALGNRGEPGLHMTNRIFGYICLAFGVAGLALPFLPGIPLLLLGLKLLGPEHPIRKLIPRWIKRKRDNPA